MVTLFQCGSFSSFLLLCNTTWDVSWLLMFVCDSEKSILQLIHCIWKFVLHLQVLYIHGLKSVSRGLPEM